jgi:hypothetical protein
MIDSKKDDKYVRWMYKAVAYFFVYLIVLILLYLLRR